MRRYISTIGILCFTLLYAACAGSPVYSADLKTISKEELKAMLDEPGLVILDVRPEKDWKASALRVKGAVWRDFEAVETWASEYPKDQKIVLYCA